MAEKDEVLVIIKKDKKEKSPSAEGQSKPL
jgi:hypothetical protein